VYRLINESSDAVLAELERISDVPRYLELRRQLTHVNVATDLSFQLLYREYWRMNVASLGDDYYGRYFARMQSLRDEAIVDLDAALRELSVIPDRAGRSSLQFSFATKLLQTIDPRAPVYDTSSAAFYFFVPPVADKSVAARLDELLGFYGFLRDEYARVVHDGLLDVAVRRMRDRFRVGAELPDERIVDLLIWSTVSLLRHGAQRRGQGLHR